MSLFHSWFVPPGVYYGFDYDKTGKKLFKSTVIPNRGAWLEYEMDSNDIFYVRIDKNRKIPATTFIRAPGISSDDDLIDLFGEDPRIVQTIQEKKTLQRTPKRLYLKYTES